MSQIFESSVFFGVFISLSSYIFGIWLKKKTGWALANPLLVSIILVIATLSLLGVSYESYARGAEIISYLLTPASLLHDKPRQLNLKISVFHITHKIL